MTPEFSMVYDEPYRRRSIGALFWSNERVYHIIEAAVDNTVISLVHRLVDVKPGCISARSHWIRTSLCDPLVRATPIPS